MTVEEALMAVVKLIKLSAKAFTEGKGKMGKDFLESANDLCKTYDLNLTKIIQEVKRQERP